MPHVPVFRTTSYPTENKALTPASHLPLPQRHARPLCKKSTQNGTIPHPAPSSPQKTPTFSISL